MDPIPPSLPFRVAQAYGQATPSKGVQREAMGHDPKTAGPARGLVAGRVATRLAATDVARDLTTTRQTLDAKTGALQMYRHPADKNAAATSVLLGRKLDVTG